MSNSDLNKMIQDLRIDHNGPTTPKTKNFLETVINKKYNAFIPNSFMWPCIGPEPQSFGQLTDLHNAMQLFVLESTDPHFVKTTTANTTTPMRDHTIFSDKTGDEMARLLFATDEEMKEDENHPFFSIIRNFIQASIERIAGTHALDHPDLVQLPDPVPGNAGFDHIIRLIKQYVYFMKGTSGSNVDPEMPYIPMAHAGDLIIVDMMLQNILIKNIRDIVQIDKGMNDEEISDGIRKIYNTFVLDRSSHTSLLLLMAMNDPVLLVNLVHAARASTSGFSSHGVCDCFAPLPD